LNSSKQALLPNVISLSFALLFCGTAREIRLVLSSLCMGEIRAIILVNCQTETAFEASDVVLEEVRILVEVDGLERELAETLSSVGVGC
jgi:hypothetical protein